VARHVEIDPALWEEFHRVVNMSSRELADWLRTRSADERAEELPDQAGTVTGQRVLHILGKRRVDLTEEDEKTMRRVVDRVHAQRGEDLEPTAGQENWRHRLMSIGHDPLKPS
jgi:glutamyl-tRNA reductase